MLWRNVSFDNQLMILSTQYGTICKGTYGQITIYSKFIGACAQSFLQNQSYNGTTYRPFIHTVKLGWRAWKEFYENFEEKMKQAMITEMLAINKQSDETVETVEIIQST